ncbi:hypothetical protein FisN_22Lh035 [Fistulifera solaris]|uniref:Uncharacterized protein n=1 Tax=Fistulifera solaris TaxID=1519565 RepID=A0A1Z5JBL9_FISSO|nr:hypothetical protein FisN_22Lh035 [Fistulifera solaris]|eukprot:GAX11365.1 hypothetical protein FisN_22Lh035 [Fistulifera solaris]
MVATSLRTSPRSLETDDQFDDGMEIDKVFCPSCSTNLVMIDHSKNINSSISSPKGTAPIAEVPFCFGCKAHVVCNAEQVQTLIQLGASGHTRIAHKGAILVATPSNIKLKRNNNKAWPASPKLKEEHELMIEYFQAASNLSTEEVEMALIPDEDNLYLTITPSTVRESDSNTAPNSPLRFLTEHEISPCNACLPSEDEARVDDVERKEPEETREVHNTMDEMDLLGATHTEDDDIDQLFGSKEEPVGGLKTVETIELIHCEGQAASNEEFKSTRATASVQVQVVEITENARNFRAPSSSSNSSQSDASSSEGGNDFDIPEYSVRREIATKALGAMMLQGYTLKEDICETCEMPMMDFDKKITCVVCPILRRRAALETQNNENEGDKSNQIVDKKAADIEEQLEKKRAATDMKKEAREAMEKAREVLDKVKVTRNENLLEPELSKSHDSNCQLDRVESVRSYDTAAEVLHAEQWELLRSEGRLAKARRLLKGWKETGTLCAGKDCYGFPLITNGTQNECMVCAGTGTGFDGIYRQNEGSVSSKKGFPDPEYHLNKPKESQSSDKVQSDSHIFRNEAESDFESKRKLVSKEVGKRLLKGWTLLDKACPYCVMPLMTNKKQKDEICVLCGVVGKRKEIVIENTNKIEPTASKEAPVICKDAPKTGYADVVQQAGSETESETKACNSSYTPLRSDPPEAHEGSFYCPLHSLTRRSIEIPDYQKESSAKNRDPQASIGACYTRKDRREPEEQKPSYLKQEEAQLESDDEENLVTPAPLSPKRSGILTLEIPNTFDFGDEESLRDLIEAAKTAPDFEECSLLGVRKPQPSPGMEYAKVPGIHSPQSFHQCGPRPPITPETAPRPKGSGLMYCASKDTISVSTFNEHPFSGADRFGAVHDMKRSANTNHSTSLPSSKSHTKTSAKRFWPPRSTRSVGSGTCEDAIALHELSFEELQGSSSGVVSLESEALDALMGRIEDTKNKLEKGNGPIDTDLRELIDGLAKTAYDMEMIERSTN